MTSERALVYSDAFYAGHLSGMTRSAERVLGVLYRYVQPKSVIDVGCGRGAWLAVAERLGTQTLVGLDGQWISPSTLLSPRIEFQSVDFDRSVPTAPGRYDLCISLEVAEHVAEGHARDFISLLCGCSDIVLFGAAVRHQGGTNHINEQWQSYWLEMFKSNGYSSYDIVRPALWHDAAVEWWYRQNTLLYVRNGSRGIDTARLAQASQSVIDVVHPAAYEAKIAGYEYRLQNPTLRSCWSNFKLYVTKRIQYALTRRPAN